MLLLTGILILIAYLFGSISSAILVCKLLKLPDPRTAGSNNPGATNVLRIGTKKAAGLTLLGDVLKGVIPVILAKSLGLDALGLALVTLAAFLGHLYPIFFRFQGGKGVATAFGGLLALAWPVGLWLAATWLVIAFLFRYSSLAALLSALLSPFYMWFLTNNTYAMMACIMSLLLIYRHRKNIKKLLRGQEGKIKLKRQG